MGNLRIWGEHILDLIDLLYETKEPSEMADALFNGLRRLMSFEAAMFLPINRRTFELQEGPCYGCAPADMHLYLRHYALFDPFVLNPSCLTRLNEAVRLSDVASTACLINSEFSDFRCRIPYRHAMSVLTSWREQPLAAIRLYRHPHENDFSADELGLLNRLAPHIAKAIYLREAAIDQNPFRETGLLVFRADRRLIFRNQVVCNMLVGVAPESVLPAVQAGSVWLKSASGLLRAEVVPLTPASLLTSFARCGERALNAQVRDGAKLSDTTDHSITIVVIEPLRRRHAFVTRLERSGLSRREVEVSLGVMRGLTNANIAQQLFIDEKTVKDHLQRAYKKTRVRTRTELMSKMLGLNVELAYGGDLVNATAHHGRLDLRTH